MLRLPIPPRPEKKKKLVPPAGLAPAFLGCVLTVATPSVLLLEQGGKEG